jgi:hypothetical protein
LRPANRERCLINLHAAFGEIVRGIERILVRHLVDGQAFLLEPSGKDEIQRAVVRR